MSMYLPALNIKVSMYIVQGYKKKGTVTQREIATVRMSICSTICAKISLLQLRLDELGVHLLFAVCFPNCVNHLCFLSGHWSRQG